MNIYGFLYLLQVCSADSVVISNDTDFMPQSECLNVLNIQLKYTVVFFLQFWLNMVVFLNQGQPYDCATSKLLCISRFSLVYLV
jgi:hypothetical protein